jgi:hypothetical protein
MKASSIIPILLLLGACAETAAFEPTENVTATGHAGQPAAGYDIGKSSGGGPYVHVNVWSDGVGTTDGQTRLVLALEIRDTGTLPVQLDQRALRLEAFDKDGRQLSSPRLLRVHSPSGSVSVAPGGAETVRVVYAMPIKISPDAIGSFRLRWSIVRQDGQRYVQFTEFRRAPDYYGDGLVYYNPVWGFYDPFFYNAFYWGPPYAFHVPVQHVIVARGHVGHVRDHR